MHYYHDILTFQKLTGHTFFCKKKFCLMTEAEANLKLSYKHFFQRVVSLQATPPTGALARASPVPL